MIYPPAVLEHAKKVTFEGTDEDKLALFAFKPDQELNILHFKFDWWTRVMYPRYFTSRPAEFHHTIISNMFKAYKGDINYVNLGFRGCAKTTYTKLFLAYAILNDVSLHRKYIKVLTRNAANARQIVTDVYNLMVEVEELYGNYFLDTSEMKREETMGSFTTADGRKLLAGTIGMTQRGHLQDAARPDFILFDDVEDRESIVSLPQTESTIFRIDEAIQGLSASGSWICNGNYISEEGVIQWFLNKKHVVADKIPILDSDGNPTWPDRYPLAKIQELKDDAEDFYGEYMCLKPGTMILTPSGHRPISSLSVGDMVISHLGNEKEVLKVFRNNAEDLLDITISGVVLTITRNHPVLVLRDGLPVWVPAGELSTEDMVVEIHDGESSLKIEKIELSGYSGEVFNLEVEGDNSYIVENFAVHNCDPSRADATFFDRAKVDADIAKVEQPHRESAGVRYYGEYLPHHAYAIGADVGEGVGRDASAMVGWDFRELDGKARVILTYFNNTLAPDLFGHELMRIGREFGNCLIAPERNNTGHGTIAAMRGYPQIFTMRDESKHKLVVKETLGWITNKKTKPKMFFEFRKDYNDGLIEITDLNLLKEMRGYTTMDLQDTRVGTVTRHFDLLTAAVIGYQMKHYVYLDNSDYEDIPEDAPMFPQIGV